MHNLVVPNDYRGGTSGLVEPGGCTLLRIRGELDVMAAAVGGAWAAYVSVIGNDETAFGAFNPESIWSGDILWQDAGLTPNGLPLHREIDINVKRRLENDKVVFVITSATVALTYLFNFRALIRSSG